MTDRSKQAAIDMAKAIASTIKALGTVPSGELYARLMGHLSLDTYNAVVRLLVRAKLVKEENHLLTWIG